MKILVADDDATLRDELAELLRGDGHEVRTFANGDEALRAIQGDAYDVALLDLVMPRATGLDILHRLQVDRVATSVVMITGHGSIDVAVEAMKAGAVDFLVKPFEMESLSKILHSIADERRARQMIDRPATSPEARQALMEEAAGRGALLAIVGPDDAAPRGATRVLRIDAQPKPPDVFAPSQLYRLNAAIDEFVSRAERPVVYAGDPRWIEQVHGRDDLRAWIRHVGGRCAAREGVFVIASADSALAAEMDAQAAGEPVEPGLQGMLESLANPIRRAIVAYVFSSGPSSYSAVLRMNFVDSSSKLSFHLQKLLADGLLRKEPNGAYVLADEGERAWRVLRALGDERRRPAVVFAAE